VRVNWPDRNGKHYLAICKFLLNIHSKQGDQMSCEKIAQNVKLIKIKIKNVAQNIFSVEIDA
jgi:hypothetical protein